MVIKLQKTLALRISPEKSYYELGGHEVSVTSVENVSMTSHKFLQKISRPSTVPASCILQAGVVHYAGVAGDANSTPNHCGRMQVVRQK